MSTRGAERGMAGGRADGSANLADLVADSASRAPAKPALLYGDGGSRSLTFRALHTEANRVAAGLQAAGVAPGDRVAIAMGNVPQFVEAYFGVLRAGAIAVPLNALLAEVEVERILYDSGARLLLGHGDFGRLAAAAAGRCASVERVVLEDEWPTLARDGATPSLVDVDDVAVLAYTSGTTGEPKGAMLTHGNLVANLRQQMAMPHATVTQGDVLFLALPLFHIFGLNVTLGLCVMNGATGVLVERFEPVTTLRLIQEARVTVLFGAPQMYAAWVSVPGADQYDLSRVRLAVSGAAPLPADVLRDFRDLFGVQIYEGYGLTETAPTLASVRMSEKPRANSIGKPLPGIELRVVDDDGNDVEVGDPGEIIVRGPNIFKGYWNRDDETRAALRDGWFHTGDVAVRDEEDFLYLVDRKRDLIIVSGFNVFPSEVEAALLQHPAVAEACVVGIPHAYSGEAVKAYVVLEEGADATGDDLMEHARTTLARFKQPHAIEIVDELPHALTGKILRRALRT